MQTVKHEKGMQRVITWKQNVNSNKMKMEYKQ